SGQSGNGGGQGWTTRRVARRSARTSGRPTGGRRSSRAARATGSGAGRPPSGGPGGPAGAGGTPSGGPRRGGRPGGAHGRPARGRVNARWRTTVYSQAAGWSGGCRCPASLINASWTTSSGASHHCRAYKTSAGPCSSISRPRASGFITMTTPPAAPRPRKMTAATSPATTFEPLGDQAVLARCPDEAGAARLAALARAAPPGWLVEVVQAARPVALFYPAGAVTYALARGWAEGLLSREVAVPAQGPLHEIPVCYEMGPDLARVAEHTRLPSEEVIRLHLSAEYT